MFTKSLTLTENRFTFFSPYYSFLRLFIDFNFVHQISAICRKSSSCFSSRILTSQPQHHHIGHSLAIRNRLIKPNASYSQQAAELSRPGADLDK